MAKLSISSTSSTGPLLVLISLLAFVVGPSLCGIFSLSEKQLKTKLLNDKLTPDGVYKLIKKCNEKHIAELNDVLALDLLAMDDIKIENCDNRRLLAKINLCKKAIDKPFGIPAVSSYCRDRITKLISLCTRDIEDLAERSLDPVPTRELDTLRVLLNKHFNKPDAGFKVILDEYLAAHESDESLEQRHSDLSNSCAHMMGAFEPIKVIQEHANFFGVALTKNDIVLGWTDAYKMCEFYLANYKQQ